MKKKEMVFSVHPMKLTMNFLYGQSILKDIDDEDIIESEKWLIKNNEKRVVDYESRPTGEYVIKYKSDPRVDKIKEVENECLHIYVNYCYRIGKHL